MSTRILRAFRNFVVSYLASSHVCKDVLKKAFVVKALIGDAVDGIVIIRENELIVGRGKMSARGEAWRDEQLRFGQGKKCGRFMTERPYC